MNKKKHLTYLSIGLITALAITNIYIFTQPSSEPGKACYKDLCIYSEQDPVQTFKNLVKNSNESHLIFAGNQEETDENKVTFTAAVKMTKALGRKTNLPPENIHSIAYKNQEPVQCGNKTDNVTLEYCQNLKPNEDQLLVRLKYPNAQENNVTIKNRTITIHAKNPQALLGTVNYLSNKFF